VRDLEIGELFIIGEFKVSDISNPLSDSFVKGDNSTMDTGMSDCEEVDDIFSIAGKLMDPVRECEGSGSDSPVPGDSPISPVLDRFSRLDRSEGDLELSKLLDLRFILGGR
jgi:hypothetical protein